ncbi:hypothetical protein Tco_0882938, partial [Tanacetum coccineum]
MEMVQGRGHGGDNGPPGEERPWQPTGGYKNAKGRKEGHNLKLNQKIEITENKPISSSGSKNCETNLAQRKRFHGAADIKVYAVGLQLLEELLLSEG